MNRIPDRWLKYTPIGSQIEGTNFIAFKVPLDMSMVEAERVGVKMDDMLNIQIINERIPNLGLVIDLTNTKKYYNSKNITDLGIEYKKIFVPGHAIPNKQIYETFTSTVTDFLGRNASNDKLIGVHCTHGLNRTGLMICYYMIEKCNISADEAISRFEKARGHKMERDNYLKSLKYMTPSLSSEMVSKKLFSSVSRKRSISPSVVERNNRQSVKTQTTFGLWLDTSKLPNIKRKRKNNHSTDVRDVESIRGTLDVNGRDLIPDGSGGYWLQVNLNDIKTDSSSSHQGSNLHTSHRHPPTPFYRSNNPNGANSNIRHTSTYRIDRRNDVSTGSSNFRDNQQHLARQFGGSFGGFYGGSYGGGSRRYS